MFTICNLKKKARVRPTLSDWENLTQLRVQDDSTLSNMNPNMVDLVLVWISMAWSKLGPIWTWCGFNSTHPDIDLTQLNSIWV